MPSKARLRNVCFTLNNYAEQDRSYILASPMLSYGIIGCEVGESGTPHLQGYLEFANQTVFSVVAALLYGRAHIEPRHGTAFEASEYCKKEGDFVESGTISSQGRRSDLAGPVSLLTEYVPMKELAVQFPEQYVRFHKGFHALQAQLAPTRNDVPTVTVITGLTGSGKSRRARQMTKDPYIWGPEMGQWFDGYSGQSDAIFEEFRGQLPFGFLLRLLDRYDCRVQYKGGSIQFSASNIVITSPKHPLLWYFEDTEDKLSQLLRRITEVIVL